MKISILKIKTILLCALSALFFSLYLPAPLSAMDDEFDDFFSLLDVDMPDVIEDSIPTRGSIDMFDLWNRTGGVRTRDPLCMLPTKRMTTDNRSFYATGFINRSYKIGIAPSLLVSDRFINVVRDFLDGIDPEEEDLGMVVQLFPYILDMTIQEHRAGFYLQYGRSFDNWVAQVDIPLLVVERNFWLSGKNNRKDLTTLLDELGGISGGVFKTKEGFGDSRVQFGYKVIEEEHLKLNMGLNVVAPTSKLGFGRKTTCSVNVKTGDSREALLDGLVGAGRQVMLEPSLGQGAWGLGSFLDLNFDVIDNTVEIFNRFSWHYLFPIKEERYMPSQNPVSTTDLLEISSDDGIPSNFPLNDIIPHRASFRSCPGAILHDAVGAYLRLNHWKFGVGYDCYIQLAEKIRGAHAYTIDDSLLNVESVRGTRVTQHKVFSEIVHEKKGRDRDLLFGLGGDFTFASCNAPKDWSLHFKMGLKF
jgi:hypothetical protein